MKEHQGLHRGGGPPHPGRLQHGGPRNGGVPRAACRRASELLPPALPPPVGCSGAGTMRTAPPGGHTGLLAPRRS